MPNFDLGGIAASAGAERSGAAAPALAFEPTREGVPKCRERAKAPAALRSAGALHSSVVTNCNGAWISSGAELN